MSRSRSGPRCWRPSRRDERAAETAGRPGGSMSPRPDLPVLDLAPPQLVTARPVPRPAGALAEFATEDVVLPSFHVWTLGCQMNASDSEEMAGALLAAGCAEAPSLEAAEPHRHQHLLHPRDGGAEGHRPHGRPAQAQGGQPEAAGRAHRLLGARRQRSRPGASLPRGRPLPAPRRGARADRAARSRGPHLPGRPVRLAGGTRRPAPHRRSSSGSAGRWPPPPIACPPAEPRRSEEGRIARGRGARAWLPIIYGCDKTCTYCIVPFARGPERSRPFDDILAEAAVLAASGCLEITLLGQNVNSWGHDLPPDPRFADVAGQRTLGRRQARDGRPDIAALLRAIDGLRDAAGAPRVPRLRFVTSHPWDLTERLIAAMAECPRCASTSTCRSSRAMTRCCGAWAASTTARATVELVRRLRDAVPGISLTTDVIVGFCGETEAQFEATLALLREVRFDQVFAAAYSPRPGTPAMRLADDVPAAEKRRRLNTLLALQEGIGLELNETWLGRRTEVLVEAGPRSPVSTTTTPRTRPLPPRAAPRGAQPGAQARPRRWAGRARRPPRRGRGRARRPVRPRRAARRG